MKKTLCLVLTVIMAITLCSCGKKDKKTDSKKEKATAETTVVDVTDVNGEPVTKANGEPVTEVKKVDSKQTKGTKSQSAKGSTAKASVKTGGTSKGTVKNSSQSKGRVSNNNSGRTSSSSKPTPTQPRTTQPQTTKPAPTKPSNPYGYKNAWNSLSAMESDCKAYAESLGMTYHRDYTLNSGHWTTPLNSYGGRSAESFKGVVFNAISSYKKRGDTDIRAIFVTPGNYKDGRCGQYESIAKDNFCKQTDTIEVFFVVNN